MAITYNDVMYAAAELAGRTRDNIPAKEAVMLRGFMAVELESLWYGNCWNDSIGSVSAVAVTSRTFSKTANMGRIICVTTADPNNTTQFRQLGFRESDSIVRIDEDLSTAYVEAISTCPDLLDDTIWDNGAGTAGDNIMRRLRPMLALRCAAHLLRADGAIAAGNEMWALGERKLAEAASQLQRPEHRGMRARTGYGRPTPANVTT